MKKEEYMKNVFNVIIQSPFDGMTLEESATAFLQGYDFSQSEVFDENIKYAKYVDTYNGVDMYYDYGADYYFYTMSS